MSQLNIMRNQVNNYLKYSLGSCSVRVIFYTVLGKRGYYFNGHSRETKRSENKTNY